MSDLFSRERLFNLYTLRALLVVVLALFAPAIPAPIVAELRELVAAIDGGNGAAPVVLAAGGLAYAALDVFRKRHAKPPADTGA